MLHKPSAYAMIVILAVPLLLLLTYTKLHQRTHSKRTEVFAQFIKWRVCDLESPNMRQPGEADLEGDRGIDVGDCTFGRAVLEVPRRACCFLRHKPLLALAVGTQAHDWGVRAAAALGAEVDTSRSASGVHDAVCCLLMLYDARAACSTVRLAIRNSLLSVCGGSLAIPDSLLERGLLVCLAVEHDEQDQVRRQDRATLQGSELGPGAVADTRLPAVLVGEVRVCYGRESAMHLRVAGRLPYCRSRRGRDPR